MGVDVADEVEKLAVEIKRLGQKNDKGLYVVKFGVIVKDERCGDIFEALNGTLRAAKKRKVITFEGEMLLQGAHDNVDIILLKE
ncbi:hypothetical protein HDV06_005021 [Boothiomyces sp. JEL0866]|nr:hypothetical protein HDV06_005021 [Boothiomyces sp. JEL0866]